MVPGKPHGLLVFVALGTLVSFIQAESPKNIPPAATTSIDFARDIAPLLEKQCLRCHVGAKAKAGLKLDTRKNLLAGGYSGKIVQSRKSADSRLIHVVAGVAEDMVVMPPQGKRLSPQEVGLLRAWIDQGAIWPEKIVLRHEDQGTPARIHWAFQPIRRPATPGVRHADWVRNGIDRFILARLEAEGMTPAPEADRATLLRRVTLDLIGLPPTPSELDSFVNDVRPDAYERVVDRLLSSPHYGEKWARPWLDLCHYGDSDGYLTDQLRPVQWRYRQWLVNALNRDLPFDQFTIEQLAGDLLPNATLDQLLATGYLRNTLSNREGGADLEEYRVEQVVDRVGMIGTTWLGLTVGCARCHDHKYDPVSQKEFYQLYACLDNTDEVNIDAPLPGEKERHLAWKAEHDRRRAELTEPFRKDVEELQGRWEAKLLHALEHPSANAFWDRQWEILGLVWGGDLGEGQLEGCNIVRTHSKLRTQEEKDRLLDYFLAYGSVVDPPAFQKAKLSELAAKLNKLDADYSRPTRAPTMRAARFPRQAYLHVRGNFRTPGIAVEPGLPACLPSQVKENVDRLALARWLVAPDNPLTPRVAVNRAWQEFFGRGLVLTSEDFGIRGERPSHPELLDWLANEFWNVERGAWSVERENAKGPRTTQHAPRSTRSLHRLIVTSATYRQASRSRPEYDVRDPRNRLVFRQASLRLPAEQVRDAALAVSGLLDRRIGGPSVFPPQPESVTKEGYVRHPWKPSEGRDRYRRGLYTFVQRLTPFAQSVTFDAPAPNRACTRRERSNTPLQALTLLNDPSFVEAARSLAERLMSEPQCTVDDRLELAFRLCLARSPQPSERTRLSSYLQEQVGILRGEPKMAAKLYPAGKSDDDRTIGAAWTGVASVLMNLHEFITRD